ncbi:coiled-coil domain-containing protein 187 isoform X3 [Monodelphis domestica]|uniref:coiled-coil domain-containing protein 187 isoform X3 n=1 Tax=Monodelphis domestica TaxID=13616 RepID=UPI0024E1DE22|nr:coiled-coil domain-containing protein 187 isoform X3 [Monodelphis domestica]
MDSAATSSSSDLFADVSLAWASLQRARHVLQLMESELDISSWHRSSSHSCRTLDAEQENSIFWEDCNDSSSLHGKLRVPHFSKDHSVATTSLPSSVLHESVIFREEPDGNIMTYGRQVTHLDPDTFDPMREEEDFNYQLELERECAANDQSSGLPLFISVPSGDYHHFLTPLKSSQWREKSFPSLDSSANLQRWPLAGIKRSFPDSRLEQVRERIQLQKHRHSNVFPSSLQVRSCTPHSLFCKHVPKRNVSKMKYAASESAYPCHNSPDHCATHHTVSYKLTPKRKAYKVRFAASPSALSCQKEQTKASQTSCGSSRTSSPCSRRSSKSQDAKPAGVSAWRKGQRLARLLLGPPPTFPQIQNRALSGGLATTKESGLAEKTEKDEHIPCSAPCVDIQKGAESLPENSQVCSETSATVTCSNSEPIQAILNLLRTLQSSIQDKGNKRRSRSQSPKGISTKKAGESVWHSKPQNNAGRRRNLQSASEGKNLPSKTGDSGARKSSEKENASPGTHRRTNGNAPRQYSFAEIQEFMTQKANERKRRCLEAKASAKKASELRDKNLLEVYRKQREVLSKKNNARVSQMPSKSSSAVPHLSKAQAAKESQKEAALEHEKQLTVTVAGNKELQDKTSRRTNIPFTTEISESAINSPLLISISISPGPMKQQDVISGPLPPTVDLQLSPVENLEKIQVSEGPSKKSSPSSSQHKEDRIRILEATAQMLKERIECMTEKLNSPGVCGMPSHNLEKGMDVQSTDPAPAQEYPSIPQRSFHGPHAFQQSSSQPASGTPEGPGVEVTDPLGKKKGKTQESGKDVVEMETKPADGHIILSENPELNKAEDIIKPSLKDSTLTEDPEVKKRVPKQRKIKFKNPAPFPRRVSKTSPTRKSSPDVHVYVSPSPRKESEKQASFIDFSATQKVEELTGFSLRDPEATGDTKTQALHAKATEVLNFSNKHTGEENEVVGSERIAQGQTVPGEHFEICRVVTQEWQAQSSARYQGENKNYNKIFDDVCISYLNSVRQKSLSFLQKLKLHQMKQEKELEFLKQKAELEAQETQKSLDELLFRNNLKQSLYDNYIHKSELDKGEKWKMPTTHGDLESKVCLTRPSPKSRTYCSRPNSPTIATWESEPRRNILGSTEADRETVKQGSPSTSHTTAWSSSAAGYSSSKAFSGEELTDSSQRPTDQYVREEEPSTQYHTTLFKLREKALEDKITAELAWIEQQKECLEDKGNYSLMTEDQHKSLTDLQPEQFSNPWSEAKEDQKPEAEKVYRSEWLVRSSEDMMTSTSSDTGRSVSFLPDPGENLKCLLAEREIRGLPDEDSCLQPQWLKGGKDRSMVSNMLDHRDQTLGQFVKSDDQENKEPAEQYCPIWQYRQHESSLEIKQDSYQVFAKPTERAKECSSMIELKPDVVEKRPPSEVIKGSLARGKSCVETQKNELNCSTLERSSAEQEEQSSHQEDSVIYNRKNQVPEQGSDVIKRPIVEPQEKKSQEGKQRMKVESKEVELEIVQTHHISAPQECKKDQEKKSEYIQYDENHLHKCDTNPADSLESESFLSTCLESISIDTLISPCDSSSDLESCQSYPSFSEFQKVTAFLVNVSESLISGSDSEAEGAQNTDVNEWQEFTDQQPLNELSSPLSNPLAIPSKGDGLTSVVNSDEKQPDNDFPFENCQDFPETQENNNISTNDSPSESNVSLPGSRKQNPNLSYTELPLSQDTPYLKLSDILSMAPYVGLNEDKEKICSGHKVCVESIFTSSSSLDDISQIDNLEHKGPVFPLDSGKDQKDLGVKDVLLDEKSKKEAKFPLPEISVSFPPPNLEINCQPLSLPFEISQRKQNLSVKKAKPARGENPEEGPISDNVSKCAFQQLSTDFNRVPAKPSPRIFQDEKIVQSRDEHWVDESDIQQRTSGGHKMVISLSGSPSMLVPQTENCPAVRADVPIHTKGDGLPLLHGGTLSEIPSPVDEVLSYGSDGLPSPTQKDSFFPSEDFPSPPPDLVLWTNGGDIDFNLEDFPSLSEEMVFPESSKNVQDENSSIQSSQLSSLSDEILPEEFSPVPLDLGNSYLVVDGHSLGWDGKRDNNLDRKEERLSPELQPSVKINKKLSCCSSLPLSRNLEASFFKPSNNEDGNDPLVLHDTGNRVLLTYTQPKTLKFKETSHFEEKYWTDVIFDKAKNDHKENLERVKYSECDMDYSEFFRSDQTSHLLTDCSEKSSDHNDQDSLHYEPSLRSGKCHDEVKGEYQFLERNTETKFNQRDSSVASIATHPETLTFQPMEMEACFIHAQSESQQLFSNDSSGCLSSQKEQKLMAPIKNEADILLEEDVHPMEEKEINFKNSVMGSQNDPRQKPHGIVDSVSTELTKKILWDALAVYAKLTRQQNVSLSINHCVTPTDGEKITMKTKLLTMPSPIIADTASTDHPDVSDTEKGKIEL